MVGKNKTYDEVFGIEKSNELKKLHSYNCKNNNPMTKDARLKSSMSHLGKKLPADVCRKLSEVKKGISPKNIDIWIEKGKSTRFTKGQPAWNKGKKCSDEWKAKTIANLKKYIHPKQDTKIEVKIQNFLQQLGIEFYTHKYLGIKHDYRCDILIPSINLVIECDGDYWHKYPIGRDIDKIRTSELISKGFKVLRLWEHEIKVMDVDKFKEILKI